MPRGVFLFPPTSGARSAVQSLVICLPALLLLSACSQGVLAPVGPVAGEERQLMLEAFVEMMAIIVPVILLTIGFAWWFRAGNTRAKRRLDFTGDYRIEFVVWVIPLLVVLFLGAIAWVGSHDLDPYKRLESRRAQLEVEVVSLDWKWLFLYPSLGVASVNELAVPVGTPVHFRLTSGTVMNTFWVPRMGGMIATMPGMTTQLSLQADRAGSYPGLSGQFSGDGFASMHFTTVATDDRGFAAWVARARAAHPLDATSFRALAVPSQRVAVGYYSGVAPHMFDQVLDWSMRAPRPRTTSHGGSIEGSNGPPVPDPAVAGPSMGGHLQREATDSGQPMAMPAHSAGAQER